MHSLDRRQLLHFGLGAAGTALWPGAQAQSPWKRPATARILVGFPAGGAPDIIARRLAEQLHGQLADSVLVDNRPGAAGRIAVDAALSAPADGTTLLLNPAGVLAINPHTYRKLNYQPFSDFKPLSLAARVELGFGVGPHVPAEVSTLAQFAQWAKTNPGKLSFGSPAAGSPPHFVGEALARHFGLDMTHVPYRGGAPALNDLMGGLLSGLVLTLGDMVKHAQAGKLRLLACTGTKRSPYAPKVATFAQQGVPGLDMSDWFGVYIAGQPAPAVIRDVAALVQQALRSPAYVSGLRAAFLEAASSSPQELDQLAKADHARWGPLVKATGFVADV